MGIVRLRIVARWVVYGEEGAESVLFSDVEACGGPTGPNMAPLAAAG